MGILNTHLAKLFIVKFSRSLSSELCSRYLRFAENLSFVNMNNLYELGKYNLNSNSIIVWSFFARAFRVFSIPINSLRWVMISI